MHNKPDPTPQDPKVAREGWVSASEGDRFGTGQHHKLRATGTENTPLQPISTDPREEAATQDFSPEPEDTLPDQLDRNR